MFEPLGICDDRVDDEVGVANLIEVVIQLDQLRGAYDVNLGPQIASDAVGAALLIGPRDEGGGRDLFASLLEKPSYEADVLDGAARIGLDDDGVVGHAECDGVLTEMDGFAA